MPYIKQTWIDEVPGASPIKYQINDDIAGIIATSAVVTIVTSITPGSPLNATRMNYVEEGIETAQETAESAIVNAAAAQTTANAAIAKPSNPSTTSLVSLSPAGSPSTRQIKQTVQIQVTAEFTEVDTTITGYFFIPSTLDGMNLLRAQAFVLTAGVTGATTIQIRNLTKYPSNDALSVAISIVSGGTVGTVGTIDTARDDVSTNDKIKISVTGASTTKAKGLFVILEFVLP